MQVACVLPLQSDVNFAVSLPSENLIHCIFEMKEVLSSRLCTPDLDILFPFSLLYEMHEILLRKNDSSSASALRVDVDCVSATVSPTVEYFSQLLALKVHYLAFSHMW